MHCQHQRKALTPKQAEKPKKCSRKQPLLEGLRNKKTSCPSKRKLVVTIPTKKAMCSRLKPLLVSHPTVITLQHSHNHPIKSAHALSFRPVSKDTIDAYYQLFANGYSAASARHAYEAKLMIEHDGNIMEELADRAINPSTQDISRLYNKWREQHLGPENGKEMFEKLEEYIKEYNLRHKDEGGCIMLKRYSAEHIEPPTDDEEPVLPRKKKLKLQKQKKEESLTVAICTPLMARIHQGIPQAGELMYVDSTASIDRYNLSMFLLSTSNVGGGLPHGVMICSDESTSTIQECLLQYKGIIPIAAFYNQALAGPKIIMTDDSEAQRQALTAAWPKSFNLLCIFYVLQSFWTWLHEGKNNIRKEHRQPLMGKMKELIYAETEQVLNTKYQELTSDKLVISYPKFLQHVKNYWLRRQRWAICLRKHSGE